MFYFTKKVDGENKYERIGGTSTGGGTFWGLGSLLTDAKVNKKISTLSFLQACNSSGRVVTRKSVDLLDLRLIQS